MDDQDLIERASDYGTPGLVVAVIVLGLRQFGAIRQELTAALGAIRQEMGERARELQAELARVHGKVGDLDKDLVRQSTMFESGERRLTAVQDACDRRHQDNHRLRDTVQATVTKLELLADRVRD